MNHEQVQAILRQAISGAQPGWEKEKNEAGRGQFDENKQEEERARRKKIFGEKISLGKKRFREKSN